MKFFITVYPVKNQPYSAQVKMYFIVRFMGDNEIKITETINNIINVFNGLLSIYQKNHVFDIGLNNAYMFMMLQPVSKGLKPYYNDLNSI